MFRFQVFTETWTHLELIVIYVQVSQHYAFRSVLFDLLEYELLLLFLYYVKLTGLYLMRNNPIFAAH